jgi:hypothetical protein
MYVGTGIQVRIVPVTGQAPAFRVRVGNGPWGLLQGPVLAKFIFEEAALNKSNLNHFLR